VPVPMKMQEVIHYLKLITDIKSFNFKSSKDLNKFIELFDDRPEKPIVHQLLIRTMAKAEYSNHNIGHYGLGFKEYTHFTSPIRRYPDLIVHRLLKKYSDEYFNYKELGNIESKLKAIGEHTNLTERHAMEAERASTKLAQTILAQKFIGQEYMGTVSGVKNFGIFVVLDDIYAEGLLNMRDLHDDYYIYDEKRNCLTGRRKKLVFHFGKRIKVKINNVNVDKRKIDLLYINK
jgi:ribonuclease R